MPKTSKKAGKKQPKRQPSVMYFRPTRPGNIDPRLIRKAVIEVRNERLRREAETKEKARTEANGEPPVGEAE